MIERALVPYICCLFVAAALSAQMNFSGQLDGMSEVPPVPGDDYGSCTGILEGFVDDSEPLSFTVSCDHTIDDPIAAHIHRGFADVAGPIVFDLSGDDADLADGIQATWNLSFAQAIRLVAGGHYVNIHTDAFPAGAIRGQLLVAQPVDGDVEVTGFPLAAEQEVPAVDAATNGSCVAFLETEPAEFAGEMGLLDLICEHSIDDPTEAHIHQADRGEAGPIIVDLGDPASPIVVEDIELDNFEVGRLRGGDLYVNVHTDENPAGEIRGQMDHCLASPTVLCLRGGRFSAEVTFATTQSGGVAGTAVATRQTDESGTFWFFDPSNQELFLKVLRGCPVTQHYWVFFSATTNVGFELTVTDEWTGAHESYQNEDLTPAEPVLDINALMTCP